MYSRGEGVPRDDKEAIKWYRLSAEQHVIGAQSNLGLMYEKGLGLFGGPQAVQYCWGEGK